MKVFTRRWRVLSLTAAVALAAVSAVSALDMSVGGGGFFAGDFGGGFFSNSISSVNSFGSMGGMPVTLDFTREQKSPWLGGGIKGFFDLTYAEISVGLTFAGGSLKTTSSVKFTVAGTDVPLPEDIARELGIANSEIDMSGIFWNIGLLLKYPINFGAVTLFPAAGLDVMPCVSASWLPDRISSGAPGDYRAGDAGDLFALWIRFGAGFDYNMNDVMFLRTVALYGIRMENPAERDGGKDYIFDFLYDNQFASFDPRLDSKSASGYGVEVRVSVGFRL